MALKRRHESHELATNDRLLHRNRENDTDVTIPLRRIPTGDTRTLRNVDIAACEIQIGDMGTPPPPLQGLNRGNDWRRFSLRSRVPGLKDSSFCHIRSTICDRNSWQRHHLHHTNAPKAHAYMYLHSDHEPGRV